ncbi:hypothetical protein LSAT2_013645 [Lamellibrachia satsuma]|nr:hypothetical protein LSAT2_013645 [Lamellibrachia satsuma]
MLDYNVSASTWITGRTSRRILPGGKGAVRLCQWFWWGTVDDNVGEDDERDARESSPQPGRRLRGGKVTGRRETGQKETRHRETGRKETRRKEMGGKTMDRKKGEWGRQ